MLNVTIIFSKSFISLEFYKSYQRPGTRASAFMPMALVPGFQGVMLSAGEARLLEERAGFTEVFLGKCSANR